MNRKTKIVVSVAGILIVTLALIGLTFGYYLTRINGNSSVKSLSITSDKLELTYGEASSEIITNNSVIPGSTIATKTFIAKNTGGGTVNYAAVLDNVINEFERTEDVVYTLECKSYLTSGFVMNSNGEVTSGTINGTCNGIEDAEFPKSGTIPMAVNVIDKTHTHYYKLTIQYLYSEEYDQSMDMGKSLSARVNLKANPYEDDKNSLAYNIVNNAILNRNGTEFLMSPKTKVAEEIPEIYEYDIAKGDPTAEISMTNSTTYQEYYWTYGTGYTVNKTTGKFSLTGVSTCKYNELLENGKYCYEELLGKYLVSSEARYNSRSTNTKISTSSLTRIYILTEAPASTTSHIIMKVKEMYPIPIKYDSELSIERDDYGTSYYFRGNVKNNHVNFAGMCWKIVRINGDGSIKLILEDQDQVCEPGMDGNWNIPTEIGGTIKNGGYGYTQYEANTLTASDGTKNSYSRKVMNYLNGETNTDSSMATAFKNFQTGKLVSYLDKLKSGGWCINDLAYATSNNNAIPLTDQEILDNIVKSQSTTSFYYDSYVRLYGKTTKEPTLKCKGINMKKFADKTEMYVGALTADEIAYAGGKVNTYNPNYYLINSYQKANGLYFWSLSPGYFKWSAYTDCILGVNYNGQMLSYDVNLEVLGVNSLRYNFSFRPSVFLKSGAQITGGNGTIENPYTVE